MERHIPKASSNVQKANMEHINGYHLAFQEHHNLLCFVSVKVWELGRRTFLSLAFAPCIGLGLTVALCSGISC